MNGTRLQKRYSFNAFDEFLPELDKHIQAAAKKKRTAPVINLLKRTTGFIPTADQVNVIRERLHGTSDPSGIEFSIVVSARLKRNVNRVSTAIAEAVSRSYLHHSRVAPMAPGNLSSWPDIREWLQSLTFIDAKGQIDTEMARAAFTVLLQFSAKDYGTRSFLHLLSRIARSRRSTDAKVVALPFVMAELLERRIPSKPQLKLLLRCGEALLADLQDALDSRRQQELKISALEEDRRRLQLSLKEATADRDQRASEVQELTASVERLKADVAAERSKVADTENHWRVILGQQLAGLAADLKTKLRHEVQEIELCLNRAVPNQEMALQRVRRIEQILQEVKQGE